MTTETEMEFHRRRARDEQRSAARSQDAKSAAVHLELAMLHEQRVHDLAAERPTLRLRIA